MTDEEICALMDWHYPSAETGKDGLLSRVRRAILAEREACASACLTAPIKTARQDVREACAAAIRTRSNDRGNATADSEAGRRSR